MPRASIKVTDYDALEAYGKEKGYNNLVKTVTKKEEDKAQLRKLVHASILMKTEIPGVTVEFKHKADPKQTDLEEKIAEAKTPVVAPAANVAKAAATLAAKPAAVPAKATPVSSSRRA